MKFIFGESAYGLLKTGSFEARVAEHEYQMSSSTLRAWSLGFVLFNAGVIFGDGVRKVIKIFLLLKWT